MQSHLVSFVNEDVLFGEIHEELLLGRCEVNVDRIDCTREHGSVVCWNEAVPHLIT